MKPWHCLLWGCFFIQAIAFPSAAQVIPDGTTNTAIDSTDNGTRIDTGDKPNGMASQRAQDNLFHSFTEFSVPNGSEVFFNNPNDIVNIFSRVTGGNISNIDGLIRANGNANLFLINPAGIVFGEGAALDIGGSFVASTAESVFFADNIEFSAADTDDAPLLTISQPLGLNFGNNPGNIALERSNLEVDSGATLAFFGGNINVNAGQISAPGGRVELASLSQGQIEFNNSTAENATIFDSLTLKGAAGGDINLANSTDVSVQSSGGGSIGIHARNLSLSGGELGASNIRAGIISESQSSATEAGNIAIDLTGDLNITEASSIINRIEPLGIGNTGSINIQANNIFLSGGGLASTGILGTGDAGSITVNSSGITVVGTIPGSMIPSGIFSVVLPGGVGNAGNIEINTDNLTLTEGGSVAGTTFGQGNGGQVRVRANNIVADGESPLGISSGIFSTVLQTSIGNAGNIEITTDNLTLTDGGRVSVNTFGRGNAGRIALTVGEEITIKGIDRDGFNSGIFSQVQPEATGNAGDIEIATENLSLSEGGIVSVTTLGAGNAGKAVIFASEDISIDGETAAEFNSGIYSQVIEQAIGDSGGIEIIAGNLYLNQGGVIDASTISQGEAGAITLDIFDTIAADGEDLEGNPSGIFSRVESSQISSSGGINIDTGNLLLTDGGVVSASTFGLGNAGAIAIEAADTISADGELSNGRPSGVFSIVTPTGEGNAGGIEIKTADLFLSSGGLISASTLGKGNAGDITVEAFDTIAIDGEALDGFSSGIKSIVTPEGEGNSGSIEITTSNLFLTGGGVVDTTTFGLGNAGTIAIAASGTITADGFGRILADEETRNNSGVISAVGNRATGNAAGVSIDTNNLTLTNNAEISVESLGQGNAGNLNLKANSLSLTNASLFASTPVGNGGNITLQIAENITLRDRSTISAQALADANGGNINIDAEFIIAIDNNNNDIIASADRGVGGNINIITNNLFGFSQTALSNTNNIDASSQFGLDGTIAINELDINPAEALEELPIEIIDVTGLVAQNLCQQGRESEFIVTGKGGMAANPLQVRDGEINEVDLVQPAIAPANNTRRGERLFAQTPTKSKIIEAQGWIINQRGNLELVAHSTETNSSIPQPINSKICNAAIDDAL